MNEERKRILDMLAQGTITVDEAALLLDQLREPVPAAAAAPQERAAPAAQAAPVWSEPTLGMPASRTGGGKMLRVRVYVMEEGSDKPVNVAVNLPLNAARIAGRMITTMMPERARDALENQDIDLSELNLEELVDALEDVGGDIINVQQEDDSSQISVRVYIE